MTLVLALTVGGSCAPIVAAVRDYKPDFVCFFATGGARGSRQTVDGPGRPCRTDTGDAPSIVAQASLPADSYQIVEVEDPDDPEGIFATCHRVLCELAQRFPEAHYVADYTGGSKSMSVGLSLAALGCGWDLSLVRGQRPDLVKVANGTEMAGLVNAWNIRVRQQMEEARRLFNSYAYASASALLGNLIRQHPVSPPLDRTLRLWVAYSRGFDAWDRFDHAGAAQILSALPGEGIPWPFLKALVGQTHATGYEPVMDLIRNAERRAARGRYDDAVARLYRAIELLAQTRLRQREPPIDSANLDVEVLPAHLRPKYEWKRASGIEQGWGTQVKLGLFQDYCLLAELDDPLGRLFDSVGNRLREALKKRNHSILAHGSKPLQKGDYDEMHAITIDLVERGLDSLGVRVAAPQFPQLDEGGLRPRAG